jgi:hypothetical protein
VFVFDPVSGFILDLPDKIPKRVKLGASKGFIAHIGLGKMREYAFDVQTGRPMIFLICSRLRVSPDRSRSSSCPYRF